MIPRALCLLAAILLASSVLLATPAAGQFGVPKKAQDIADKLQQAQASEAALGADGSQATEGYLSAQDAADMEELIKKAKSDPQTVEMIAKMRAEMGDELEALGKEPQQEILGGMKQALDEIKMLDYLFKDKERALREMEKDGLIEKKNLKKYKEDPSLLEEDTRRGLYFQFVSLAVAGGFM